MNELAATVWEKLYPDRRPWAQLESSTQAEWSRFVDVVQSLSSPTVAKADADTLANAIEYTIATNKILHPNESHIGMEQALETYRTKYPTP